MTGSASGQFEGNVVQPLRILLDADPQSVVEVDVVIDLDGPLRLAQTPDREGGNESLPPGPVDGESVFRPGGTNPDLDADPLLAQLVESGFGFAIGQGGEFDGQSIGAVIDRSEHLRHGAREVPVPL